MKYFNEEISQKVQLMFLLEHSSYPIDFRFGNLKHISKETKELIKKNNIGLAGLKNIQGFIGAFCLMNERIFISELLLNEDVDILESIILHEIGHILHPEEICHTKIDKFAVDRGFGDALYRGLKLYVYVNGHLMKDEPSVRYRRRKIKEYLKNESEYN